MTYTETLEWMFAQLPMYQQKGKTAFKGKLDHILDFCTVLEHPETLFKSIHVAGTNGKGSCSHMLASILQEAGYKVGLYTSPHLKDFRERIKINGKPIAKKKVVEFIARHRTFLTENSLSFFEMTVGMAFDYFAGEAVDIAIIEVGLGGRLDSTNIIIPEVSLITNIGYDHMDILGNSLVKIASEKAGIIKNKVPVVVSEYQTAVAAVFEKTAKKNNAKLIFADRVRFKTYSTDLLGQYQTKNSKGVLATLKELNGFSISEKAIEAGLLNVVANTGLLGRWQVVQEHPRVVYDTAHNSEGFLLVLDQITKNKYKALHMVLGMVKEKNLAQLLPLFPKGATYYFCGPNVTRGLEANRLRTAAQTFGLKGRAYTSVNEALETALKNSGKDDFIFVGGSTFTIAEVL